MKLLERNAESSLSVNEQKNVEPTARRKRVETRGENSGIPFKKRADRARGAAVVVALVSLFAAALVPFAAGCSGEAAFELKEENGEKYYCARVTGSASALKGELVIPSEYGEGENKFPVREIADQGFAGSRITKVTIPASVNKLGGACFMECPMLKEVVFEDGGTLGKIEWSSFVACRQLEKVILPSSVTEISNNAFYSCESLSQINLPEGLEIINLGAFESCTALKNIVFPQSLRGIGPRSFHLTGLEEVIIPDGVTEREEEINGEKVVQPAIGYAAFCGCLSLKKAVVGKGVHVICEGVFGYCTALEQLYLPAGLTEVKGALVQNNEVYFGPAFHNDDALKTVYFGGTEEEWNAVKINMTQVRVSGQLIDNSPLTNAPKQFSSPYNG